MLKYFLIVSTDLDQLNTRALLQKLFQRILRTAHAQKVCAPTAGPRSQGRQRVFSETAHKHERQKRTNRKHIRT